MICYSPFFKTNKLQILESSIVGIFEQPWQMFSKSSQNIFDYFNISQIMRRPNLSTTLYQLSNISFIQEQTKIVTVTIKCQEEQFCFIMCIASNVQAMPVESKRLSTHTHMSRQNSFRGIKWSFTVYCYSRLLLPRCKISYFFKIYF